ncbi:penicillin-binding protein [Pseudoneobacillus rhizosphaerae]|uniref:serine-type D-Ala-D-Ala carboxypeptidase n=1 Tax=Pseudoneobacillus rhizosphaerae TaxID=2880968 RepID=A0A9C7L9Z1_9BACI|nr:penicillin-binding protein [Pseudoneobacillus rhizosphaerae]CAG9607512.1 Penicillin-binding protein 2B [Pseudoneobacillus rhizosphaerae]
MIKKQRNINIGAAVLFFGFGVLFFVLLFRFASIQLSGQVSGQVLTEISEKQYNQKRVIPAVRGTIFDKNGEVIAEEAASYTLVAILDEKMPKHVKDPEKTAKILAKYIDLPESEIQAILSKPKKQVEFGKAGKDIPHQTKQEIEKLKLPGISFLRDSIRFYPNGIFSSHLVGFIEEKKDKDGKVKKKGTLGIEQSLDKQLTGKNGSINYESDIWGLLLPNGKEDIVPAENGKNVYLTIDKKIQTFLEDALNKVDEEYKPMKMIAIVASPKTGEILAMGQRPSFHPKTREGINKSWHNEAIETPFEPGSTMKIFTLAAAIEEKKFDPNEWYMSGGYKVGPNTIRDHNWSGWGSITYLEGVQRSSNVAFAKLASDKLGFEKFREYLTKFGFDQPTGIDLPNETSGTILYNYPLEKVTTSFGQGSTLTPIQQIQAATAIANDGKMMKPYVIKKIVDADSKEVITERKADVVGKPISAATAKQVRDILESVVTSPNGTGNRYQIDGYSVAGKTGTAQIPGPDGKYLTGAKNYIFSFLGMAPKDNPELIVYVAIQQPEIESYFNGSIPVSMIFNSVMKNSLQYMNIEPVKTKKAASIVLPNVNKQTPDVAKKTLEQLGLKVIVLGNGTKVIDQLPNIGSKVLEGEKIVLKTDGNLDMPDLTGWSLRDTIKVANLAALKLNPVGKGFVVKQNISPSTPIEEGEFLIVDFETPLEQFEKEEKAKRDAESPKDDTDEIEVLN